MSAANPLARNSVLGEDIRRYVLHKRALVARDTPSARHAGATPTCEASPWAAISSSSRR